MDPTSVGAGAAALGAGERIPRVGLVIPALDEEQALPLVLEALPRAELARVLVVDNGSSDGTAEVARRGGAVVVHEPRRGYGSACLAGIAWLEGAEEAWGEDGRYIARGHEDRVRPGECDDARGDREHRPRRWRRDVDPAVKVVSHATAADTRPKRRYHLARRL